MLSQYGLDLGWTGWIWAGAMRGRSTEGGLDLTDASFALPATPPFHLEATVRLLQRRPANRVDLWESGHYRRVLPTHDGLRPVAGSNPGTVGAPPPRGEGFRRPGPA